MLRTLCGSGYLSINKQTLVIKAFRMAKVTLEHVLDHIINMATITFPGATATELERANSVITSSLLECYQSVLAQLDTKGQPISIIYTTPLFLSKWLASKIWI